MPQLSAQELADIEGRYNIASLRQLIKAHNRFNDLTVPKKLKKQQLIQRIYSEGFRLSTNGSPKLTQSVNSKKTEKKQITLKTAQKMKKKNPNVGGRGYGPVS